MPVNIETESDFTGVIKNHFWSDMFSVLDYASGGVSLIPHRFFRTWLDQEPDSGTFSIGRCSAFGIGSIAQYDAGQQRLRVGRFVSGGKNLRFILNGQHNIDSISTYMFTLAGPQFSHPPIPQYGDSIIKNDVWIGDEAMMLGGGTIEHGCVIGARTLLPPNFRSEPFGIYVGSPARLVRFRFPEKVCAALLELAWWDMPMVWLQQQNSAFLENLNEDEGRALDTIARLQESRQQFAALASPGNLERES